MEPVRQHYLLATTGGVQPAPSAEPRTNFIPAKDAGTAKNPHPNPMMKKGK